PSHAGRLWRPGVGQEKSRAEARWRVRRVKRPVWGRWRNQQSPPRFRCGEREHWRWRNRKQSNGSWSFLAGLTLEARKFLDASSNQQSGTGSGTLWAIRARLNQHG